METGEDETNLTNPSLPPEVITAMLVRFPVKYLLQLKCLSKSWLTFISSPDFVKAHLRFSAKDFPNHRRLLRLVKAYPLEYNFKHCSVSSLFSDGSVNETFDLDHPMKNANKHVCFVGSVNGLICLRIMFKGLVVWNPSTRKFKQVPGSVPTDRLLYGFGYDEVHDDYKIVVTSSDEFRSVDPKIYSFKRDFWKKLDDFHCWNFLDGSPKFVNRKLHWLTYGPRDGSVIMSFDLVDEKFRNVELPCFEEIKYALKLAVLESLLSVFFDVSCNSRKRTDVWVMKEYGVKESWMKLYTIKYPFDGVHFSHCIYKGEIAFVSRRGNEKSFVIYNPEDGSIRYPKFTNIDGYAMGENYFESLVCPNLQNEPPVQC